MVLGYDLPMCNADDGGVRQLGTREATADEATAQETRAREAGAGERSFVKCAVSEACIVAGKVRPVGVSEGHARKRPAGGEVSGEFGGVHKEKEGVLF